MPDNNNDGRGFASMPEDEQREIARKGGQASRGGGRGSNSDQ
jgi:general stress protein YciG